MTVKYIPKPTNAKAIALHSKVTEISYHDNQSEEY